MMPLEEAVLIVKSIKQRFLLTAATTRANPFMGNSSYADTAEYEAKAIGMVLTELEHLQKGAKG